MPLHCTDSLIRRCHAVNRLPIRRRHTALCKEGIFLYLKKVADRWPISRTLHMARRLYGEIRSLNRYVTRVCIVGSFCFWMWVFGESRRWHPDEDALVSHLVKLRRSVIGIVHVFNKSLSGRTLRRHMANAMSSAVIKFTDKTHTERLKFNVCNFIRR